MQVKKIISGLFLVVLSLCLGFAAFYFWEVKPELASREKEAAQQPEITASEKPKDETRKTLVIPLDEKKKVQTQDPAELSLQQAVNESKPPEGQGHLWINRKTSKYVVTLGSKNGLEIGSTLLVYQGETKLGKVEVDTVYDTIAYVHPIDISTELSEGDYYRVIPQ